MFQKILVPTDGSKLSTKAINSAINLSKSINSEILALKVIPEYLQIYSEGMMPLENKQIVAIEKKWENEGNKILTKVKNIAEKKGVLIKTLTDKNNMVSDCIIKTAIKNQVDLIVMASHGRNRFQRLILGSEAVKVLHYSKIPVLIIR